LVDPIYILVEAANARERLDSFLAGQLPEYSRSRLANWIREELIRVNGQATRPRYKVQPGDEISFVQPEPTPCDIVPQEMDLNIVHRDESFVIVNKPAGLIVHPGAGHPDGTLVNGLVHMYGALSPIGAPDRPGVVHRIDAGTSGLLVFALTELAHNRLAAQFSKHSIERVYHALVWDHGLEDSGTIETLHGRHHKDRRKFTGKVSDGKRAVTHWAVLRRLGSCALVEVRLETGRTHQIRVHFSEHGCPLVGDQTYGRRRRIEHIPSLRQLGFELGLKRQALHAAVLGFEHPVTGEAVRYESETPADVTAVIAALAGE